MVPQPRINLRWVFSASLCKFFLFNWWNLCLLIHAVKLGPNLFFLLSLVCKMAGPIPILIRIDGVKLVFDPLMWFSFLINWNLIDWIPFLCFWVDFLVDWLKYLNWGNLFLTSVRSTFWNGEPLLTFEHTGVALASAVCLREGSWGTYAVVPGSNAW